MSPIPKVTRRTAIGALSLAKAGRGATPKGTAISLNEDANHFYASRFDRRVTVKDLTDLVDQYAGTQVRELIFNVNAQRTAFDSKVWTSFWKGYDPQGPDDQPLFAGVAPAARKFTRAWVHNAWQMNEDGLDQFTIWIRRARERGISPWLSIRMNDLHNVEEENHSLHSEFWKAHPELRRISYRGEMRDRALDFGRQEVREYTFALIEEVAERYHFDGLELDWMRHGFHFAPGREAEGREHLNAFMQRVRRLLGRRRKIGVRVPPHPDSALSLGMDAVTWARNGWTDMVVPTNFWRTVDTAMPLRVWRQLLPPACILGAGFELGLNPHIGSRTFEGKAFGYYTLKTVRGAAAAYLEQGADRIYLFNYMDRQTAMEDREEYETVLRQAGSANTLAGKARRHIVTYTDTFAPGEPRGYLLPAKFEAGQWRDFRLATGPVEKTLEPVVRLGLDTRSGDWKVRVNGVEAKPVSQTPTAERPWPEGNVCEFAVPPEAMHAGETVVEVTATSAGTVHWVEVALA